MNRLKAAIDLCRHYQLNTGAWAIVTCQRATRALQPAVNVPTAIALVPPLAPDAALVTAGSRPRA